MEMSSIEKKWKLIIADLYTIYWIMKLIIFCKQILSDLKW